MEGLLLMSYTLLEQIEQLRNELYELYQDEKAMNTPLMLEKSNELDQLILKIQKQQKQYKQNKK